MLSLSAERWPNSSAYQDLAVHKTYRQMLCDVDRACKATRRLECVRFERVAVWGYKSYDYVVAMIALLGSGYIVVPINPALTSTQVEHILSDSRAVILLADSEFIEKISHYEKGLRKVGLLQRKSTEEVPCGSNAIKFNWQDLLQEVSDTDSAHYESIGLTDSDPCCILYTSGSTGRAKGVVLSHRNLVAGASSVTHYLGLSQSDVVLGILPVSFDAGLSQLTTAILSGASYVPVNYLIAHEVPRICERFGVTTITAVPPLWMQLIRVPWSDSSRKSVLRVASTGGRMPFELLQRLRTQFPKSRPYLMYGLTEAFRSTYLDPEEIDRRPDSIGKAIPNAEILVLRPDGSDCLPDEVGELVHRGATVALGYWNDPMLTKTRFRKMAPRHEGLPGGETAVWSGDLVRADKDGFLYFVARTDDMIKTMGYRVSPTEVEEILYSSALVSEAAVVGIENLERGQEIVAFIVASGDSFDVERLRDLCRENLPGYMQPVRYIVRDMLPRSPNGKIDRKQLRD